MSYWNENADKMASEGGLYLKMKDGEERMLMFKGHEQRDQRPETPAEFKSVDGKEIAFLFSETLEGKDHDRIFTAKSFKNALSIAMQQADVQPGETIRLKRTGAGMDTRYTCSKIVDGIEHVSEKSDAPF